MDLQVVNIGEGLIVPAECAVVATECLRRHFQQTHLTHSPGEKQQNNFGSKFGRGDELHTAIDILIRGTYPGPLVNALFDWDSFKRPSPKFNLPYNRFRVDKILRKYLSYM